jgi:hypothetical protein
LDGTKIVSSTLGAGLGQDTDKKLTAKDIVASQILSVSANAIATFLGTPLEVVSNALTLATGGVTGPMIANQTIITANIGLLQVLDAVIGSANVSKLTGTTMSLSGDLYVNGHGLYVPSGAIVIGDGHPLQAGYGLFHGTCYANAFILNDSSYGIDLSGNGNFANISSTSDMNSAISSALSTALGGYYTKAECDARFAPI